MAVKGLGADGNGSDSDLADGIVYAVENGARVINASWGADSPASPVLEDALDVAHAAGVVFVAAAGNSGSEVDYTPFTRVDPQQRFFPAAFRQAIAVGAVDHTDARAAFSNYGVKIDVVAPGGGDQPRRTSSPSNRSCRSRRATRAPR
jgi:thermitase